MIKHVNDENFNSEIGKNKGICLVDFYATWCGPCMMLAPVLEEISNSRAGYDILKVDVDKSPEIASKLGIDTIPTLCVYKEDKLLDKQVGFKSKNEVIALMGKYL
ncbi:MAG: thioredoxin [Clostridia bacterium]